MRAGEVLGIQGMGSRGIRDAACDGMRGMRMRGRMVSGSGLDKAGSGATGGIRSSDLAPEEHFADVGEQVVAAPLLQRCEEGCEQREARQRSDGGMQQGWGWTLPLWDLAGAGPSLCGV